MENQTLSNMQVRALAAQNEPKPSIAQTLMDDEARRQLFMPECFRGEQPMHLSEVPRFVDKLRQMLEYDPQTGLLYYAFMPRTALRLQEKATWPYGPHGYTRTKVWGFGSSAASVVWLLHHGRWPVGRLLRKDGDATNDRIENLVEAVPKRLGQGRKPSRGVARSGAHHWQAYTFIEGVQKNLGRFKTEEEAIARRAAWDRGEDLV